MLVLVQYRHNQCSPNYKGHISNNICFKYFQSAVCWICRCRTRQLGGWLYVLSLNKNFIQFEMGKSTQNTSYSSSLKWLITLSDQLIFIRVLITMYSCVFKNIYVLTFPLEYKFPNGRSLFSCLQYLTRCLEQCVLSKLIPKNIESMLLWIAFLYSSLLSFIFHILSPFYKLTFNNNQR